MEQPSLPVSPRTPVEFLSSIFNHVTNSYKFYWFLAILDHIREDQSPIVEINTLVARMVAGVWYPTNYFRLSFGKQDRLSEIALLLKEKRSLRENAKQQTIVNAVLSEIMEGASLAPQVTSLSRYVPYRFLRPFFSQQLRGKPDWKVEKLILRFTEKSSSDSRNPPFYRFVGDQNQMLEIHPIWFDYLQTHLAIVTSYCSWHLLKYLQRNNPNVPNLAGKLFEPEQRDLSKCRQFWRAAFDEIGTLKCIYSGIEVGKSAFSLDHFLPWSFVTHDQMWNIVPTLRSVNSAKSDSLPDWSLYFGPFAELQYKAFQAVATSTKNNKLLEDYVLLFNKSSVQEIKEKPFADFLSTLNDALAPQIQIAKNMGFTHSWRF